MNKLFFIFVLMLINTEIFPQNWDWTKIYLSDSLVGYSYAYTIGCVTDLQENIYVAGNYKGSIQIDTNYYQGNTSTRLFMIKYDQSGNLIWSKTIGGMGYIETNDIVINNSGYCFVTGRIAGTIEFDSLSISSGFGADPFIAKFDSYGNFVWATVAVGYVADDLATSITIDEFGDLYITGRFEGNATFGNHQINSFGFTDIFIAKCDNDGNFLWAKNAGASNGSDIGRAIDTDTLGNVYLTGSFEGTANFGSQQFQSYGFGDIFLTKMSSNGNFIWTKQFGSSSSDYAEGISLSELGDIGLTGSIRSGISGAQFGNFTIFSNGESDIFIAKINSADGSVIWVNNIGGPSNDTGIKIIFDSASNIYFISNFLSYVNLGDSTFVSNGWMDFLITKSDKFGNFRWTTQYGTSNTDVVIGLSKDQFNNLYVSGGINGQGDSIYTVIKDGFFGKLYNEILPVEITSFAAFYSQFSVKLNWSTATEINNHGFEVERSNDNSTWRLIGFKEGNGTTIETHNYSFVDDLLGTNSSKLYYRLKQIDYDGSFEYSDIVDVDIAPSTYSLSQNYPNPFNPTTKIKYSIPPVGTRDRVSVQLKVYDVLGKEVATLVHEEKTAGKYEVEFNAAKLTSGIYFYQLKVYPANGGVSSFVETKKMLLLK